ncbi:phosphotransferase enzyme family-domain-containing protein [Xylariales sp. PMI_506]|nr:phosphotransferase enzyme family-domain-containing protein [Xylariales sp. PMI_506]
MRVTLPVDPGRKTRGEVATLQLVTDKTTLPVPEVIAYDDSSTNEIEYEWILMELMLGRPVHEHWRQMSMEQKETLVKEVAGFQAQLLGCTPSIPEESFRGIGTLGAACDKGTAVIGPLVSQLFCTGDNYNYPVPRGPFSCTYNWLRAYLDVIIRSQQDAMANAEDDEDREDAENDLKMTKRLEDLLPILFTQETESERTVLWHDDLNLHNILVDANGRITAVIDWEFVSTMLLWVAGQFPNFLSGTTREEEPYRNQYSDASPGCGQDDLDNEGKNELYWIHRMEFEQTQLRKVYAESMRSLWPEWTEQQAEYLKIDFLDAESTIASGWVFKLMPSGLIM